MKKQYQQQAIHKQWMMRLLAEIADNNIVAQSVAFKGGTCAVLLGYLDRFSVDLDFDLLDLDNLKKGEIRKQLHKIFTSLNLKVDQESDTQLQFFLKYDSKPNERNTLKLEIIDNKIKTNLYQKVYIQNIDRYIQTQSIETMFANKLVAPIDRFEKHNSVATRDIYDINYFFNQGFSFNQEVVKERTKVPVEQYLKHLIDFIQSEISSKNISEDLNFLLTPEQFKIARKYLKTEVINNINMHLNSLE